jgi:hypothetical protein
MKILINVLLNSLKQVTYSWFLKTACRLYGGPLNCWDAGNNIQTIKYENTIENSHHLLWWQG